jgi:Flp pilus assembly protein TadG
MNLQNNARSAAVDGVTPLWNGGTIAFFNSSTPGTIIVTVNIPSPAFGAAASGVATANAFTEATATNAGVVDSYTVKTSGGVLVCSGTVGTTSGYDFVFSDTTFNIADRLQITGITYTQPAS